MTDLGRGSAGSQANLLDDGAHARLQRQRFIGLRVDDPARDEGEGELVILPGIFALQGSNGLGQVKGFCDRPIPCLLYTSRCV